MNSKVVVGLLAVVGVVAFFLLRGREEEMDFGPGPEVEASPFTDEFTIVEYGTTS